MGDTTKKQKIEYTQNNTNSNDSNQSSTLQFQLFEAKPLPKVNLEPSHYPRIIELLEQCKESGATALEIASTGYWDFKQRGKRFDMEHFTKQVSCYVKSLKDVDSVKIVDRTIFGSGYVKNFILSKYNNGKLAAKEMDQKLYDAIYDKLKDSTLISLDELVNSLKINYKEFNSISDADIKSTLSNRKKSKVKCENGVVFICNKVNKYKVDSFKADYEYSSNNIVECFTGFNYFISKKKDFSILKGILAYTSELLNVLADITMDESFSLYNLAFQLKSRKFVINDQQFKVHNGEMKSVLCVILYYLNKANYLCFEIRDGMLFLSINDCSIDMDFIDIFKNLVIASCPDSKLEIENFLCDVGTINIKKILDNHKIKCESCQKSKPRFQFTSRMADNICSFCFYSKDVNLILGILLHDTLKNSKRYGREHHLSLENLQYLYNTQNGLCALSKKKLSIVIKTKYQCSIQRIDPSQGYIMGNVRLVILELNSCETWTSDFYSRVLQLSQQVYDSSTVESHINFFLKFKIQEILRSMKNRNHYFQTLECMEKISITENFETIMKEEIVRLLREQNFRCFISKIPMQLKGCDSSDDFERLRMLSIERKDNKKFYQPGNICFICFGFQSTDQTKLYGSNDNGSAQWSIEKFNEVFTSNNNN